ncbi:MAG: HNH endonuclease [Proteobacteria bacterium]|nr:HNH endonuclease [Pseudomonadota bacterium]
MNLSKVKKKMPAIKLFLAARGAEVLATTNPYELIRFRSKHGVSVLYKTDKGQLTHTGQSFDALSAYFNQGSWSSGNAAKRRRAWGPDVRVILERDGEDCFLCLRPLGNDITREHLVALVHGGPDHIANKVLTHAACNLALHHLSLMEKIRMRERNVFRRYGWDQTTEPTVSPASRPASASNGSAAIATAGAEA